MLVLPVIEDRAFINSLYLSTISLYAERTKYFFIGTSLIIEGENSFNTAVANEPSFNGRGVYEKQLDNSWLWIEEVWLYTWSLADFTYTVTEVYDNTSGANMYIGDYVVLNYKEDLGVTSLNVPCKSSRLSSFLEGGGVFQQYCQAPYRILLCIHRYLQLPHRQVGLLGMGNVLIE